MLVATVTAYIIANTLNFALTAWEYIDVERLRSLTDGVVYSLSADIVRYTSTLRIDNLPPVGQLPDDAVRRRATADLLHVQ